MSETYERKRNGLIDLTQQRNDMRNVSLVLLSVSLSLHFSAHSMLRSVRSRMTMSMEEYRRVMLEKKHSLHQLKMDLDEEKIRQVAHSRT